MIALKPHSLAARRALATAIRVVEVKQTCSACPSQWQGVCEDGEVIYVRYRWGRLSIGKGPTLHDAVSPFAWGDTGRVVLEEQIGGEYDGEIRFNDLKRRTLGLVVWPQVSA